MPAYLDNQNAPRLLYTQNEQRLIEYIHVQKLFRDVLSEMLTVII